MEDRHSQEIIRAIRDLDSKLSRELADIKTKIDSVKRDVESVKQNVRR